jgi:hypothetical protein
MSFAFTSIGYKVTSDACCALRKKIGILCISSLKSTKMRRIFEKESLNKNDKNDTF